MKVKLGSEAFVTLSQPESSGKQADLKRLHAQLPCWANPLKWVQVYPRICSLVSILHYCRSTSQQGETVSTHNWYFSLWTQHTDHSCARRLNPPKHMQTWSHPWKISRGCCSCKSFTIFNKTFPFLWQTSNHQWFKSLWERHQVNPKLCETEQLWVSFALKF